MRRFLLLILGVLLWLLPAAMLGSAAGQQTPELPQSAPWFPALPPEYKVADAPEIIGHSAKIAYDTLSWVNISGNVWLANYEPRASLTRSMMDVFRHFRDQINLRGGRRLLSNVHGDDGKITSGTMVAYFPGAPPLWLEIFASHPESIQVKVVEVERSDTVELQVPPERTPGRWELDEAVPASMPPADRTELTRLMTALSRFFRSTSVLKTPVGFDAKLGVDLVQSPIAPQRAAALDAGHTRRVPESADQEPARDVCAGRQRTRRGPERAGAGAQGTREDGPRARPPGSYASGRGAGEGVRGRWRESGVDAP